MTQNEWPLWEVFVRSRAGLDHKHCGSLHAADPKLAIQMARASGLAPRLSACQLFHASQALFIRPAH